jgi:hypothetical protein
MSSYTSRIRLEKQIPGQNDNTWGTVLNGNVIDLVDDSIAAYTTITVSSVDVTLTQANGASDQARSAFLDISGALTGNVNVVIPALSKGYGIRNSTSGSFTVNMKTLTGSGQFIPQGQTISIICDGVSVRDLEVPGIRSTSNVVNVSVGTSKIDIKVPMAVSGTVSITGGLAVSGTVSATNIHAATKIHTPSISATNILATTVSATNIHAATKIYTPSISATTVSATNIHVATKIHTPSISATTVSATNIVTTSITTSVVFAISGQYGDELDSGFTPVYLLTNSPFTFTINSMTRRLSAGTIIVSAVVLTSAGVQTTVTGLNGITADTTKRTGIASANNIVAVTDALLLNLTGVAATDRNFSFTLKCTRSNFSGA